MKTAKEMFLASVEETKEYVQVRNSILNAKSRGRTSTRVLTKFLTENVQKYLDIKGYDIVKTMHHKYLKIKWDLKQSEES